MTETPSGLGSNADRATDATASAMAKAKQQTGEWADRAAGKLDAARQPVADKLHGAANAVRGNAERLYDSEGVSEGVSDVAHSAADRIESSATYLESHDVRQIAQDLVAVVKRYPTQSLLIAGAVGFLCGRAFRSN